MSFAGLDFDPLLPLWLIATFAGLALAAGVYAMRLRAGWRTLAILAVALALANPALVREEREPLPDVVALIVDESPSMAVDARAQAAAVVAEQLRAAIDADPELVLSETRLQGTGDGTGAFGAVARAAAAAPRGRLSAVLVVTDGQAHDAPEDIAKLGVAAPVHVVVVGDRSAVDRRLEVVRAPSFGIVGEDIRFVIRVEDAGAPPGTRVPVAFSIDGAEPIEAAAEIGRDVTVALELARPGANVVQITAEAGPSELTLANNAAAVSVSGVRDRLRVLLVTGEPHAGARTWRDLLKSDPSVDLVHFTILRPPEKQDGTPIEELSLIAFPTRELFEEKLDEFDLVIFDRYRRRGILQPLYFENLARYVEDGGALLLAEGPPFAGPASLHLTSLSAVLPARPTARVLQGGFRPTVTATGLSHPVTAALLGAGTGAGAAGTGWGRWFQMVEARALSGATVLEGQDRHPLLILDRVGDGRVGLLLSDNAWMWARGIEGGGPYGELLRRLAHWLMKEPELDEESLTATVTGDTLSIRRRTMGEAPTTATVVTPSGERLDAPLTEAGPGLLTGTLPAAEPGLYRVLSGFLSTVAASGALNPEEFADLTPTGDVLAPLAEATGGGVLFAGDSAAAAPTLRRTRPSANQAGRDWLGLPRNGAYAVTEADRQPLMPALLAVALVLGLAGLGWSREGR